LVLHLWYAADLGWSEEELCYGQGGDPDVYPTTCLDQAPADSANSPEQTMCAVWIHEKRWHATGPFTIGVVIVWSCYTIMDLGA
jgi:hypothetical protein